ncbi:MAG TPA: histidine phosphatase family protein [Alphaproteobacteria bacterium]|nr:histidine phosphatase family protein [Alphaproteobacteria bacterium]
MKTLILLRHAKSSRDDPRLADAERPLAPRGRKAVPKVGRALGEGPGRPDLVLCSAARRAVETWEGLAPQLGAEVPAKLLKSLYMASPSRLLATVRRAPDAVDRLLLVGHNPGLEELALRLAGSGERAALERMAVKFPTGAFAELRFAAARWADIGPGGGELRRFVRPRDLD